MADSHPAGRPDDPCHNQGCGPRLRRRPGGLSALLVLLLFATAAWATSPTERLDALQRGISVTGWFRFPASADPTALRGYLSDQAMADIRRAGFSFVRLAIQPEFLRDDPARSKLLVEAIRRLQHHGLAVLIDAHPSTWNLEDSPIDRDGLLAFWRNLAPALRLLDPALTFPELLNEPVFPHAAERWQALQHELLVLVRGVLPQHTIILTGNDWGSIGGLLALRPEADDNVIYSFHFYEPAELTALAAYRAGLDRAALARLPFPAGDDACVSLAAAAIDPPTAALMRFYCSLHWDVVQVGQRIDAAADWGRRNHTAVLLGEFGASAALNRPARTAWLRAVREACEAHRLGWALWGYDDIMGLAVARPPAARPALNQEVLQALGLGDPG
jgi:hypothetical protein